MDATSVRWWKDRMRPVCQEFAQSQAREGHWSVRVSSQHLDHCWGQRHRHPQQGTRQRAFPTGSLRTNLLRGVFARVCPAYDLLCTWWTGALVTLQALTELWLCKSEFIAETTGPSHITQRRTEAREGREG